MTKQRTVFIVALLLLLVASVEAAPPPVEVLSVVGRARAAGKPLVADDHPGAGTVVELTSSRAVVQLLLARRLALSLCDGGGARLLGPKADVLLIGGGTLRAAGKGTVVAGGMRAELNPKGGATVLFHRGRLYVLDGGATVRRLTSYVVVSAGHAVRVGTKGELIATVDEVPPSVAHRTVRYQLPPPWVPDQGQMEVGAQVRRARQRVRRQRERERELATCGCTESSGSGIDPNKEQNPTVIEGRRAKVRVRIRGVPRRIQ